MFYLHANSDCPVFSPPKLEPNCHISAGIVDANGCPTFKVICEATPRGGPQAETVTPTPGVTASCLQINWICLFTEQQIVFSVP